jgi:hypothetical protein
MSKSCLSLLDVKADITHFLMASGTEPSLNYFMMTALLVQKRLKIPIYLQQSYSSDDK